MTTPTEWTHLHHKSCLPRFSQESSLCLFSTSICSSFAASCLLISRRFDDDKIRIWDCHWKQASLRILPKLEETADVVRHKTGTYYDCNTPNNRSHLQNCSGMYDIVISQVLFLDVRKNNKAMNVKSEKYIVYQNVFPFQFKAEK